MVLELKELSRPSLDLAAAFAAAKMAPWTFVMATQDVLRSPQFNALLGLGADERPSLNQIVSRLLPGERERISACVRTAMTSDDHFFRVDFRIRRFDNQVRWFLLRAQAIVNGSGDLSEITGMLIDLTERKVEELENAYLASVVASTPYAVISVNKDRRVASWNDGAVSMFGYTKAEAVGKLATMIIPADARTNADGVMLRTLSGETITTETTRLRKDWTTFPVKITAAPVLGPDGSIIGASGVYEDRTEAKAAEERQALLVRELHHRVRNTLSTVQGIAGVTAGVCSSIDEFRHAFTRRIGALAQTHSRLTEAGGQTICVSDLIDQELGPFVTEARVAAVGPNVALSSQVAPTLAMMIHELATNAVKHGALRGDTGTIEIRWTVDDEGLDFFWAEHGTVEARTRSRKGFGTTLLDLVVPAQFGSEVFRSFAEDEIRVTLRVPLG
ncbi:MAG: Signal transduction histidine kinase [Hyphomicrobiales bacterium]|nr:Signal transduction histidine kinase [Hyphomicrobiales bacterium]